ncbi:pyruvate/2-oxoglutarate dehydrogenase complex dihydrolipoamide acyltransferase (E2) component [Saccharopolyspora lacisalsi]|uniref:Pyruvate/2-oxoglutarate dehydrogenase complex dihydrolipoamide acyltransferase (E2) component n=2 Tax=Halosaccharopolyspora lacisalsi TaxID=1000566 RepID=A0A839DRU6_9PSEU|nr:pyruvate/2-oxoglutarate dehydrogenase complex dihydrolipoamide acyltransferase (E2) component [Halosaccharopolyspora lacisalsi]
MDHGHKEQAQPDPGPLTTRIVGELPPLDQPSTPAHPAPEQLEVTQPYIPAVREQPPDFARRLSPEQPPPAPKPTTSPRQDRPAESAQPAAEPTTPASRPESADSSQAPAAAPRKRRSLARRVVRRIIGPDLLRKDPPKRK